MIFLRIFIALLFSVGVACAQVPTTGAGLAAPNSGCTATNLVTSSANLASANWTLTGGALTSGQADPLNGTNAYLETEDSSTGQHQINNTNFSLTSGTQYMVSAYSKRGPTNDRDARYLMTNLDVVYADVNLSTGVVTPNGAITGSGSTNVGLPAGWWRYYYLYTPSSSGAPNLYFRMLTGGATNYAGNGTSNVYWFGPQVEVANGHTTPCTYNPT